MRNNILKRVLIDHKFFVFVILSLLIIVFSNFTQTGVMLNDELIYRFLGMQGIKSLAINSWQSLKNQGRVIGAIPWISFLFLNFLNGSVQWIGFIRITCLAVNLVLFGILLKQLFRSTRFSLFVSIVLIACMPITFEHTIPNAYNVISIGFSFFLLSLVFFILNLKKTSVSFAFITLFTLFISLIIYESFVMLTPLYFVIVIYYNKNENRPYFYDILKLLPVAVVTVFYLLLYGILRNTYPTQYSGNKFAFASVNSSFEVICQLIKSSVPGYFLTNKKYAYLVTLYSGESVSLNLISNFFHAILSVLFSWKILLFAISFFCCLLSLFGWGKNEGKPLLKEKKVHFYIILLGILFTAFLAIPYSVSDRYPGIVNENDYISLPISYCMMYSTVFTICFIIWNVILHFRNKWFIMLICICITFCCIPIQHMNGIFSKEQNRNFSRLVMIENLFETQAVLVMRNKTVSAEDFFSRRNTLAISNDYWTKYSLYKGVNSIIANDKISSSQINCYLQDDKYFVLRAGNVISVLSPISLSLNYNIFPVRVDDSNYLPGVFEHEYIDGRFFRYNFYLSEEPKLHPISPSIDPFEEDGWNTGNDLPSAKKMSGYYEDGWIAPTSKYLIRTQDIGLVSIGGYYPGEITSNLTGVLYINDIPNVFTILEQKFSFQAIAPENEEVTVCIENGFIFEHDTEIDAREFSFILNSLDGK